MTRDVRRDGVVQRNGRAGPNPPTWDADWCVQPDRSAIRTWTWSPVHRHPLLWTPDSPRLGLRAPGRSVLSGPRALLAQARGDGRIKAAGGTVCSLPEQAAPAPVPVSLDPGKSGTMYEQLILIGCLPRRSDACRAGPFRPGRPPESPGRRSWRSSFRRVTLARA